jgi:hypothetical protein
MKLVTVDAAVTINIPNPGTPLFDARVVLNGVDYILLFDWHDREQRFYMSVYDQNGVIITAGLKLLSDWPLYSRETLPQAPNGQFFVVDPDSLPAQLPDFGLRTQLLFIPVT